MWEFLPRRPSTSGLNLGKMVTVELGLAIMNDASLPCFCHVALVSQVSCSTSRYQN